MGYEDQITTLLAIVQRQAKQIEELTLRLDKVEKENYELRRQLNQDSSNSSKPPSSDSIFKKSSRPSRKKSKRKPGGQVGHKGHQLKKFEQVNYYEDHHLYECPHCQCKHLEVKDFRIRQVADIPLPTIEVTEHSVYAYQCQGCGTLVKSDLYEELKQEVQYGPRLKGLVNYLNVYQLIPYKRLTELIEALYGHKISQGSISNFNSVLSDKLESFTEQMKQTFIHSVPVMHSDETGCMVSKTLHWLHVYSDNKRTLLEGHSKRGRQAMNEIGILNHAKGTVVHDRFSSYNGYEQIEHALCNAHLLRDLKSVENEELNWPTQIKDLLLKAKQYKENNDLSIKRANRLQRKYESILREQRQHYQQIEKKLKLTQKGNLKRAPDHNLHRALWKYRKEILLFMYREDIPFDNNQGQRDLRMFKVKMKISNQFKNLEWMNVHARIRSFISTAQKQGANILENLTLAHQQPQTVIHLAV